MWVRTISTEPAITIMQMTANDSQARGGQNATDVSSHDGAVLRGAHDRPEREWHGYC
jgi:hypothetical protein